MERWHFGLDPSAIRDGTYTDIFRGQQLEFAAELRLESWTPASAEQPSATRAEGNRYDVAARIEAVGDDAWVLDCGLWVGCPGRPPEGLEVGAWLTGRVALDMSPHPDRLRGPGLPPFARTWFVERVHHRTGPDDLGLGDLDLSGAGLYGGPEEPGWEELAFTDAWRDDDGRAEYLVECLAVNQ